MNDSINGGRCSVDAGGRPIALDITARAQRNSLFRAAVWTGRHLQAAVLCVPPGGQAGPEQRPDADQLIGVRSQGAARSAWARIGMRPVWSGVPRRRTFF